MVRLMDRRGFTLIEIVIVLAILAMAISMASFPLMNLAEKIRLEKAVGEVRAALNTARIKALLDGVNFRVRFAENRFEIEKFDEDAESWTLDTAAGFEGAAVEANNSPIFTPEGTVTNLATIRVVNRWGGYKMTLAITGRIKTIRLPS
jgi:prepilin-type N-terminal cleavage/methylation domain-containing protein